MTTMTVLEVVTEVRAQLQDASKRYWSDAELVDYLVDGRMALYSIKPEVYETTEEVTLVAGPMQTLPNGSDVLFRPLHNVTAVSQREITTVDGQLLARARPRWRSQAEADEIVHVLYRDTEPKVYEVYPPAKAGTKIKLSYAKPPEQLDTDDLVGTSPALTAEGDLAWALIAYCLHRAFAKQADTSPDAGQMSGHYLQLFTMRVGGETQGKATGSTNATARGMTRPAG